MLQICSNAGQDEAEKIRNDASKFIPADTVPSKSNLFTKCFCDNGGHVRAQTNDTGIETPEEFIKFNFGYDVVKHSKQEMEQVYPEWSLPETFFEREPIAPLK